MLYGPGGQAVPNPQHFAHGCFGLLYLCRRRVRRAWWDVRTHPLSEMMVLKRAIKYDSKDLKELEMEMQLLWAVSALQHPRIVRFLGQVSEQDQDKKVVCRAFLMERMDCSLDAFMSHMANRTWDVVLRVLEEIAEGLQALHQHYRSIVHRDLHMGNVLIKDGHVKLSDFWPLEGEAVSVVSAFLDKFKEADAQALADKYGPTTCTSGFYAGAPPEARCSEYIAATRSVSLMDRSVPFGFNLCRWTVY